MSENQPLFSIIIPAYNREKFVGAALCSVAAQTFTDWECIVVDDGSTDGTCVSVQMITGILQGLAQKEKTKEPCIRLIKQKNGGPGAARNQGSLEAKGKYLAFLDSDDLWMPWTLETYREALEKAGWPEYLAGEIQDFADETEVVGIRHQPLSMDIYRDTIDAGAHGHVYPGAGMSVVSAEAFRHMGGFCTDRLNGEDHDLVLRLGESRGFVAVRVPVVIAVRRHGIQETASMGKTIEGLRRLLEREKKGMYPGGRGRARERRMILTAHVRPVCVACLRAGRMHEAWQLYMASFWWQMAERRWKFVVGFFPLAVAVFLRRGR